MARLELRFLCMLVHSNQMQLQKEPDRCNVVLMIPLGLDLCCLRSDRDTRGAVPGEGSADRDDVGSCM